MRTAQTRRSADGVNFKVKGAIKTWPRNQRLRQKRRLAEKMDRQAAPALRELPRYRSFKEVWALKIDVVVPGIEGAATIFPAEEDYDPFYVDAEYVQKHNPQPGGYYVVYQDGYKSFSPASAFESGYTRI